MNGDVDVVWPCRRFGTCVSAQELLKNADLALYRAKSDGRGVYRLFEPEMDAKMRKRRDSTVGRIEELYGSACAALQNDRGQVVNHNFQNGFDASRRASSRDFPMSRNKWSSRFASAFRWLDRSIQQDII